jgi:GntR family transcriptional regulator/MocR family aminotransferase
VPLHRQLYAGVRALILDGRLLPGAQLPSSRVLARELEIARLTVVQAFEQLVAEGYLTGKVGAGTFVARSLPDDLVRVAQPGLSPVGVPPEGRALSRRGALIAGRS